MHDDKAEIDEQQDLVERIRAVSAVEKAIQRIFEFSHNAMTSACRARAAGSLSFLVAYSERSASTGSFLDARREGISPAIKVSSMLISTSATDATKGSFAPSVGMPVSA